MLPKFKTVGPIETELHILKFEKLDACIRPLFASSVTYSPSPNGEQVLNSDDPLMLPVRIHDNSESNVNGNAMHKCTRSEKKRFGKGSNILTLIRTFLNESENWKEINGKQCYQFPGVFSSPTVQYLYYTPDTKSLHQSSET